MRTGAPSRNRHSLHVEIERKLCLDEETLSRSEGFLPLKQAIAELAQEFAGFAEEAARISSRS
ncbi:MAG: hypothetical protein EA406_01380 [Rhodospirillales bacterium]|nr:MAG: hypothetical protein EA406_01380 [Rhodospirillales bacterium]